MAILTTSGIFFIQKKGLFLMVDFFRGWFLWPFQAFYGVDVGPGFLPCVIVFQLVILIRRDAVIGHWQRSRRADKVTNGLKHVLAYSAGKC